LARRVSGKRTGASPAGAAAETLMAIHGTEGVEAEAL
jgi:hypothetical protein